MASKAVVDAVENRLGAEWNGLPVIRANTTGEPPDGATDFIEVQYPVADNRRMPINEARYREEGAFRIVLNAERGNGPSQALTWCDDLARLFRDQKFGGVTCKVPSSPFVDDDNGKANFFQVSMVFPYTYDFQ